MGDRRRSYRPAPPTEPPPSNIQPPLPPTTPAVTRYAGRITVLEAEVKLNQRHIAALQEETVRREMRLKAAEARERELETEIKHLWERVSDLEGALIEWESLDAKGAPLAAEKGEGT